MSSPEAASRWAGPAELFFSSAGRIGRRAFAPAAAVLLVIALAWRLLTPAEWPWWWGAPVYALVLFSAGCLTSKRLHDRGNSGWWGLILFPALLLVWAYWPELFGSGWRRGLVAAAAVIVGSASVQLLLLRGQPTFNRWGPP